LTTALPPTFIERMHILLGDEADAFFRSYEEPRTYGLRLNPLKLDARPAVREQLTALFGLQPLPWCTDGFRYRESERPGRHLYHMAGLYYIQEPSAMIAAELLDARPGETVLDLAAAPGGKTTQIAAGMQGRGLLVANEIHPGRAKILSENIERLGIVNALVTQATPQALSERFPERFDRVLLDAPCSGEGMFRKDPAAIAEWSPEAVEACAARQRDILPHAAAMLKPGGALVYSTCTFNSLENEETIADFLTRHPSFRLIKEERMWPHRGQGEGHYAALLRKEGDATLPAISVPGRRESRLGSKRSRSNSGSGSMGGSSAESLMKGYEAFACLNLPAFRLPEQGHALSFGDALYWMPAADGIPIPDELRGLRVLRSGLRLGELHGGGRFEPDHALAIAVAATDARLAASWTAESAEAAAYCRGEALPAPADSKGWGIAAVDGFPLGWFKASNSLYKNHRPKGLRL